MSTTFPRLRMWLMGHLVSRTYMGVLCTHQPASLHKFVSWTYCRKCVLIFASDSKRNLFERCTEVQPGLTKKPTLPTHSTQPGTLEGAVRGEGHCQSQCGTFSTLCTKLTRNRVRGIVY